MFISTCNPSNLVHVLNFLISSSWSFLNRLRIIYIYIYIYIYIAHLRRECQKQNKKNLWFFFREKFRKILKCYKFFLWVQRRHNCPTAASFANCVMTLWPVKKCICKTFLSVPITQKRQILSTDSLVADKRYVFTALDYNLYVYA